MGSVLVRVVFGLWLSCAALSASAEVALHPLFTPGAVLQRQMKVPVWGTAADGEKITVRFAGQTLETTAADGRWRVTLEPLEAGGPHELVVSGTNTLTVGDVLVGEVWIASGQSNMQWAVAQSADPEQTIAAAQHPRIRFFTVPREAKPEPQSSVAAVWQPCTPETTRDFSAVAYAFGHSLQAKLDVPIGLISTNFGGTPAEAWTSREKLEAIPELAALATAENEVSQHRGAGLYNAMIAPLIPYAIRGAIWYQGESNADRAQQYRVLFPAMIADWRQRWEQGDFPFFFVQLAPFQAKVSEPVESAWAELREAQRQTSLTMPNTAMAVITDLGDEQDIHPKQKKPVGERLALAARAMVYGEKVEYSGPTLREATFAEGKARLAFDHLGGGLVAQDAAPTLSGFTICGADHKWVNAQATIVGDFVDVHAPGVAEPVAVRYGWADFPLGNLGNRAGLPATPFRTDDFPWTTP